MIRNKFDIKTGVIGVGSMGQNHARIYSEISNLVAVSDPNEKQGRKIADRFGVIWYSDYREMLDVVDAVTVAVPTALHREIAENTIKAGIHLLVEKPLAGNTVDAKAIVTASETVGVILAVGHVERHNPVITHAKEAIKTGKWGDIITMSSRRVSNFPDRIHDVGVLFDLSIHDIDISTYLCDSSVVSVYAVGGSKKANHEDYINLILNHKSGVISICETNWLTPMKIRKLGITTIRNYIELDYIKQSAELFSSKYLNIDDANLYGTKLEFESEPLKIKNQEPLLLELMDFLSSIKDGTKPLVTGHDAVEVIKVSEAAFNSLKENKLVKL